MRQSERDEMQRALWRLLEAHEPRLRTTIRLRLVRD
jgi:predicted component of type VI protein secretion system